ncbi:MAG: shikimate kinase [Desulfobulbaceae bacterium]|nr:shikimate kinase [Desulfobulbaceae bacterium]
MLVQKKRMEPPVVRPLFFERILLTGFRATGKSLVGRLLADRLALDFLDTDALLCRLIGCSVSDFVAEHGWARFREQEERLLTDLCRRSGVVIATGGGAVLHKQAWAALRSRSASIWLRADERTIQQRLVTDVQSEQQRPSLTGMDPSCEINTLLAERTPLYRLGSDFAIRTDGRSPRELVKEIEQGLTRLTERKDSI